MAKKSKTSKRTGKRQASPKAKAPGKSGPKVEVKASRPKRKKGKKTAEPKAKVTRKSRPKASVKVSHPKQKKTKRTAAPKAKVSRKSKPKASVKASHSKRKATPKAKVSRKSRPKASVKTSHSKRKATPKAKVTKSKSKPQTSKKRVSTKAKAHKRHTRVKASAKRRAVSKRSSRRKSVRKSVSSKAKTSRSKSKSSIRKRHIAKRAKPVKRHVRHSKRSSKSVDFDFNSWLLPEMELEKHELSLQVETGIEDNIKGSTRYAWIGSGQCGGRLVKSFYDIGYKKVLAVNTTHNDLDLLELPKDQKFLMDIGEKGAGKDMNRGKKAAQEYKSEILHHANKIFGSQVDHIMVCFGAGGGTGSGSAIEVLDVAKRYARYVGLNPDTNVGVLMTLPTIGESSSPIVAKNAYNVVKQLSQMAAHKKISPFIIVDNDKVQKMYPGLTVKSFWPSVNQTVAGLFDIFNRLSALSSQYTAFDASDYRSIMQSGGCTIMGLTKVNQFKDKFAISHAVKQNLERTLLASGFELSSAQMAGCIVVGSKKLMSNVPGLQDNINYAFDVLSEITGNASVHRGIYEDNRDYLRVYTVIGGLDAPLSRLQEMVKKPAGVR